MARSSPRMCSAGISRSAQYCSVSAPSWPIARHASSSAPGSPPVLAIMSWAAAAAANWA